MPRTKRYEDPRSKITIDISPQAEQHLGPEKVGSLVENLTEVMSTLGVNYAYVSKRGGGLEITVQGPNGWTGTMKVKK